MLAMENVDSAIRYIQRQFSVFENEAMHWNNERKQLEDKVKSLESERAEQENRYKDALMRIKMLEFALRQERGRYLLSPAPVTTTGGVNSKRDHSSIGPKTHSTDSRKGSGAEIFRPVVSGIHRAQENGSFCAEDAKAGSQVYRVEGNGGSQRKNSKGYETEITREISRTKMKSKSNVGLAQDGGFLAGTIVYASKANSLAQKFKLKLSGHMDGVRSLSFHPTEPYLVSGSQDCTVRLWNLATISGGPPPQRPAELASSLTLRNHGMEVLAVSVISAENYSGASANHMGAIASAGRDGSIILTKIPRMECEKTEPMTYEEYQDLKIYTKEAAHGDAIWDLHTHPLSNILFSAGADGVVRTWGIGSELLLKSELQFPQTQETGHNHRGSSIPTSVHTILADTKTCAIGYTSGSIAQFDFHCGSIIQVLHPSEISVCSPRDAQVNKVVSHPTMPILITAHHDRRIRIYDIRAGDCIGSIYGHQDSVSSVTVDSTGLYIITSGDDGYIRTWSIADRQCVYETSAHKAKYNETIHDVVSHPTREFVATAGADGIIKIYQ